MAIVDELIAILGYKIEGKDKLREFQSGLDKTEKKSKESAKAQNANLVAAGKAGSKAGIIIAGGITAAAAASVKAVKDYAAFELQMARIGITAGVSQREVMRSGEELQRMAQKYAMPLSSVMEGLNVLTASGKDLKEAMAFLPSILLTAQASGAAVSDIANTAIKASDALKIPAARMQKAFDIMVEGGKAGQFELNDMAQYLPDLANSFSTLGYTGEESLQKLIALAQTVRARTATAGQAATSLGDVFGKIFAPATGNAFKKMGVDLEGGLAKAKANGEDLVQAFLRLTREATKGNMELLPKLFADKEFRRGIQALLAGADDYSKFLAAVSGKSVDGAALRDFGTIADLTSMKMQKLGNSWDQLWNKFGAVISPVASPAMDSISKTLENALPYNDAMDRGMEASGIKGFWNQLAWSSTNTDEARDAMARKGGYVPGDTNYRPQADSRKTDAQIALPGVQDANSRRLADIQRQIEQLKLAQERTPGGASAISAKISSLEGEQAKLRGSTWMAGNAADANKPGNFSDITNVVASINANLASVAQRALATGATITDARQDNRQFPVTTTVTVNVAQATDAPRAVGQAVGNAVSQAAAPARMNSGPAN